MKGPPLGWSCSRSIRAPAFMANASRGICLKKGILVLASTFLAHASGGICPNKDIFGASSTGTAWQFPTTFLQRQGRAEGWLLTNLSNIPWVHDHFYDHYEPPWFPLPSSSPRFSPSFCYLPQRQIFGFCPGCPIKGLNKRLDHSDLMDDHTTMYFRK